MILADLTGMKIFTTRFGEIDINKDMIIKFPSGIPGHERLKRYCLIEHRNLLKWLQAVDDPEVAFISTDPFNFFQTYSFKINDDDEKRLGIKIPSDVAVLVFLSIYGNRVTANLKEPVIINSSNRTAARIKIEGADYSTKTLLPGIF